MKNTTSVIASSLGLYSTYSYLKMKNKGENPTQAQGQPSKFNFAYTFNPMFEKRHKQGEDSFVALPDFICVCDGVGGWIRKLVETGNFSREFAVNIQALYLNK